MMTAFAFLLRLCVLSALTTIVLGLKLGAFNVKVLGPSKASKEDVMGILARIAVRYDILLVQEIKDKSGQSIVKLLQRIQKDHGITMSMSISDRLGRSSSKEQYAFLYRKDHGISVVDSFHFDDGDEASKNDSFEREPFIARFRASNCKVKDFSLVALHTMPSKTVDELKTLTEVVQNVKDTWKTSNIMVLGDLNADCNYVPKKAWPSIQLRQDSSFWWAVGDDVDTTVNANTDCAYDRFVIAGRSLKNAVVAGSVQRFDFQAQYSLTADQALAVSDHYPIELTLQDLTTSPRNTSSHASGSESVLKTLQRVWHGMVKKFTRWRSDSDL